jgi:hypothetical protein
VTDEVMLRKVTASAPVAVCQQGKQCSASGSNATNLLVQLETVVDSVGVDALFFVYVVDLVILAHDYALSGALM